MAAETTEGEHSEQILHREIERATLLLELYEKALHLTEKQLYDFVLDKAVQLTGSKIGFFHRVAEDQNTILLTTWNRAAQEKCTASYETHYPIDQAGIWVDCVHQKRPIIYNDYASAPNRKGLPEGHSPIERFITVPVLEGGQVQVIFGVGNRPEDYSERDLLLVQLVANELYKIIRLRKKEQALLESETRYKRLLEAANAVVWEVDGNGNFTYLSPQVKKLLDYEAAELIGRPCFFIMLPEEGRQIWDMFDRFDPGHPLANFEATFLHKNGQQVFVESSFIPVLDSKNEIYGFWGVSSDITRRQRADQEIKALNAALEQRVASRTAELEQANHALQLEIEEHTRAEDQIQKLNKNLQKRSAALEFTNQELESFAYSVSHDLRAPLRHIHGYISMLKENLARSLDGDNLHFLNSTARAAENMSKLIDDLLSFSRMGRKEFSRLAVNPNDLVGGILLEFQPEVKDRLIQWQIVDLPVVTGDPVMLRMVLVNLISNALKFTRSRPEVRIEIGTAPAAEAGGETVFYVRDNGVGFDMRFADKLFGVFQRLHRVEEFEGTGIGLANVRRIIARHGGHTWAEGRLNEGATFYFSLPNER